MQGIQDSIPVSKTHEQHIQPEKSLTDSVELLYRIPQQPSLDGNTVDTEHEHIAFSSNAMEYQASLSFLNSKINGLRKAIKGE
jgi:flagellar basal-body rod protein FlgB